MSGDDCPITSVHIVESSKIEDGFTYVDFMNDYKIGFSKTADSPPITNFEAQLNNPCLSPITPSWPTAIFEGMHYMNEINT